MREQVEGQSNNNSNTATMNEIISFHRRLFWLGFAYFLSVGPVLYGVARCVATQA